MDEEGVQIRKHYRKRIEYALFLKEIRIDIWNDIIVYYADKVEDSEILVEYSRLLRIILDMNARNKE